MLKLKPLHKSPGRGRLGILPSAAAAVALAVLSLVSVGASAHEVRWHSDWRPANVQYGPTCATYRGSYRGGHRRGWRRSHYRPRYRHAPLPAPVYVESSPYYRSDPYYRRGPGPGALIGAAIGGLVGAQVGSGEGRLASTAAGVVGGFLLGQEIDDGR